MRVLVVDNYDSFVYNLVQYLGQLGAEVTVLRNDDPSLTGREAPSAPNTAPLDYDDDVAARLGALLENFDGVLLSPGPGVPELAGATPAMIHHAKATGSTPILGVCLGHQAIGTVFGATVGRAPQLMHGKTSEVVHDGSGVLDGLPDPFTAMRYHSLTIEESTLPEELVPTARTADGTLMAVRHRELPIHGVQFHPESVASQNGHQILANWMRISGFAPRDGLVEELTAAGVR
ncbi:anthranilate synthase component II [Dietzia sp.]|uniref:anthranilate synthase component II n=1 Tax=Dietzia sp. TaxID=1871616 RepID=UPI002FD88BB2